MSINGWILELSRRGMLSPLVPIAEGSTIRRAMFLTEEVEELVNARSGDAEWDIRIGYLRADLERFVDGRTVDPKYLFLLYPAADGIWEIRSVRHAPSIRVFGAFAGKDVFIATTYALREDLGGWDSREWKQMKRRALARWRTLFQQYPPVQETDVKKLVTGALNGRYLKSN